MTTVATHYERQRRGGGRTQVAVIAGVGRTVADPAAPVTIVELRAYTLDVAYQFTEADRRWGVPQTAVTTNQPALRNPRVVTPADTVDSRVLRIVLDGFVRRGAHRLP